MAIKTCPRCGTGRPGELQWCRNCGLDFHKAERGELPSDMRSAAPTADPPRIKTVQDYWHDDDRPPTTPVSAPAHVRLGVDRRWLARLFGNAMDVGLLASIGAAFGWITGLVLGELLRSGSQNLFGVLMLQSALAAVGGWLGARIALWAIAHWPTD